MSAQLAVLKCPVFADVPEVVPPPHPDDLAYRFTMPVGPLSPRIARASTRVVLEAYGMRDMVDAAVQVVGELVACAWQFTPDEEAYVSLRYREGELEIVLYDGHRRHGHPKLVAACDARRRGALRVLGCVVRACRGEWGFGEAREPGGGTRMWVVLPRWSARGYSGVG
ncbi:ATP-binding protein [Streptomyces adelaidensis]|uniref:ATP-binding protein n=1 Tax=Streptomyces adelaidensis TaxID=2796465 RepID=UPI001F17C7E7|nr:ATP-binding protein [Streptomyces adelaidensis]